MIKIKDGRTELYQWDTGSVLTVGDGIDEVHFARSPMGRSITVPVVSGEAKVEDVLLQTAGKLFVWGFVGSAEDGYTKLEREFTVRARNKPADYVFTPPEQITLSEILEELKRVQDVVTPEAVGALVEEYLRENPVEGAVQTDATLTKEGYAADAKAVGDALSKANGADVTAESIKTALGYTPADEKDIENLSGEKVDKPTNGNGTPGQALLTNGDGTTYWANTNDRLSTFLQNTDIDYAYDNTTGAYYTVIRVYRDKLDGTKQYPFVLFPNDGVGRSTKELNLTDGWCLAINGGIFYNSATPDGMVIENGVVLRNEPSTSHVGCRPLTIDQNGTLGFAEADANANTLVGNGIVSAVSGFMPIIIDYEAVPQSEWNDVDHYTGNAQRQIIGQWGCGDYAIITCEGRSNHNSDGWTIMEAQQICIKHGLKFAYNLDGGGSTETMLGFKHINTIYEGTNGRKVPTFIVFNGKDIFEKPNKGDIEPPADVETYTQLEYISFTGEQYIDPEVTDKETLGAECEFEVPQYRSSGTHILSSKNSYFCVIVNGSKLAFKRCGSAEMMSQHLTIYENTRHVVSAYVNGNSAYCDDTLLFENVDVGSTKQGGLCIGAYGGGPASSSYRFAGNVYGIKIYDGANIIRNYIPAMNTAGTAGLLDVVNNKFYTSSTDIQCVAGPVLS
jgi:hypothetical protein